MGLRRTQMLLVGAMVAMGLSVGAPPSGAAHAGCGLGNPALLPVTMDQVASGDDDWYDASSPIPLQLRGGSPDAGLPFLTVEVYAWDGATACTQIDSAIFWGPFGVIGQPFNHLPTVPAGQHLVRVTATGPATYGLVVAPPTQ